MLSKPDPGLGLDIPERPDRRPVTTRRLHPNRTWSTTQRAAHEAASGTAVRKHTMSTTLSTHPPQPAVTHQAHVEVLRTSRPNLVDKLALRVGLWLITYGRRSYAQPRVEVVLPDRAWSATWVQRPGA
jgi:hypothetical protein